MTSLPDTSKGQRFADFVSLNRYYGWYVLGGAGLADAEAAFHHEMDGWAKVLHGRPLIFTEYGTDNLSGAHKLPSVMWSAEYQNEYLEMTHAVFDHYDFVQGELVWNFADFQTTEGILRVDGNKKASLPASASPRMRHISSGSGGQRCRSISKSGKMIPENSSALPVYPGRALLV